MDADQEQQIVAALNSIDRSLQMLCGYAFQAFVKFNIPQPQPPVPPKKVGHPIPGRGGRS